MICKFCGNEIDDNADFCFVCGQKATPAEEGAAQTYAIDPQPEEADDVVIEPLPVVQPAPQEEYVSDPKDGEKAGWFTRFICFICPIIGLIIYGVRRKQGQIAKMISVANATWAGVCFYLALGIVYVVYKFMLAK